MADMPTSGFTLPHSQPSTTGQGMGNPVSKSPMRKLVAIPVFTFISMSVVFAFLWDSMAVPVLLAVLVAVVMLPASMPAAHLQSEAVTVEHLLPVGMFILAEVTGILTGIYTYEMYSAPFYAMSLGRSYENVLASTPGAAYADAGKIHFADSSLVQVDFGVGYRRSPTYCVAPVMDSGDEQMHTVAFWAVGFDCCQARGLFMCGAATALARGGVRVRPDGIFTKVNREFRRAIDQAAAVAELAVVQEPILLHWVLDPQKEQFSKLLGAGAALLLGNVFFALLSVGALLMTLRKQQPDRRAFHL